MKLKSSGKLERRYKYLNQRKVLIGSPVCQKWEILEAFLLSLKQLSRHNITMDYMFVDDNTDEKSCELLTSFKREESTVIIIKGKDKSLYVCDEDHHWDDSLMLRVANYKNEIISYAIDNKYDELFFVDSDLILHPELIAHLESKRKEIVSEIFWTQWHAGLPLEPNVWLFDEYDLVPKVLGEELGEAEKTKRQKKYISQLKKPGLYEVGGLGACTLIRRSALLKGVNFSPIKNLTIHGEDRFFCIRAAVLGIELYVDTCAPAYHIYREQDLEGVSEYMNQCKSKYLPINGTSNHRNKITLSMVVKNEEGRYLSRVLKSLAGHISEAVIIDDASTDQTVRICEDILTGIPLHIIRNRESMFGDEIKLRKLQWEETIKTNPDWILNLDADELVEESFWNGVQEMIDNKSYSRCCFRLYDMWNETQYREDKFWNAHNSSHTFLLRYNPDFEYQWRETAQHCGRFPVNCDIFPMADLQYRIQHYGWADKEDRVEKYKRYQLLDPGAIYGIKEQYESILDAEPHLLMWR